jgi:hypothetical protein
VKVLHKCTASEKIREVTASISFSCKVWWESVLGGSSSWAVLDLIEWARLLCSCSLWWCAGKRLPVLEPADVAIPCIVL